MRRIPMTMLLRLVPLLLPLLVAAVSWPRVLYGQEEVVLAARGPRFFSVPATPKAGPVEVDVRRNAFLRTVVSLNFKRPNVGDVLTAIERQTGLQIFYSREVLPANRPVSLRADRITVAAALMEILVDTGVDVLLSGDMQIALVKRGELGGVRQGSIVGQVMDTDKLGMGGVEVFLEGTRWRAQTDTAGWYRLTEIEAGIYTLTARRLGYTKLSRQVTIRVGQHDTLHLVLSRLAVALNELVTTATGQQRRRDIGNAVTTINGDSLMRAAPIRSLTDMLNTRVPGLTVQHTSGAPGDPARLRLRGIGSVLRGNDPVVIVDGVRIYSAHSDQRSGNLTNAGTARTCVVSSGCSILGTNATGFRPLTTGDVPAPSPLDQIDPNTIEKIEVFKGPSAATLYGADAANGVIVVTTKKGRPGPTRWNASITHGRTDTPGKWPTGYYRWGHVPEQGSGALFCTLTNLACIQDSLLQYQALNDPDITILGRGRRTSGSLTASGGSQALTYHFTGTYSDELGLLQLPAFEVERFRTNLTREVPDWMRRPHHLKSWSIASAITALLGPTAEATLSARAGRTDQQRTALERNVSTLAGTYLDRVNGTYYTPSSAIGSTVTPSDNLLRDYYQRTTASALTFTTNLNGQWRPRFWLTTSAQAGLNVIQREDETLQPPGLVTQSDGGAVILGNGRSLLSTINLRSMVRRPLPWNFNFETNVGLNLQTTTTVDLIGSASGLRQGTSSINGATTVSASESRMNASVFGWYIEPRVVGKRISLSAGLRLDGGSNDGTRISQSGGLGSLLSLPKLNGSWVISEEPWFPLQSFFSSLRLRGAYGQAQVQPGPGDRLRIFTYSNDGIFIRLAKLGNPNLRPERSTEFEGGIDADMLDSRVTLDLTAYRKTQVDAHMLVQVAPSVNGGDAVIQNIGNIRNTGLEVVLGLTPVQTPMLTWSTRLIYSSNSNTLVKLGDGVLPDKVKGRVEGYPVGGRWAKPILGYSDANANEVLERSEIQLGDSLVYMGRLQPAYTTTLSTNLALFGGAVAVTADFAYESGATQIDETAKTNWVLSRPLVDPSVSFVDQAAVLAMDSTEYGLTQDVSTFRFTSVSLNYRAPTKVARLLRAQQMSIGIQGSNLGLHSTYRGKDPDVSAWNPGVTIRDSGQLPLPRTWQLAVYLQY